VTALPARVTATSDGMPRIGGVDVPPFTVLTTFPAELTMYMATVIVFPAVADEAHRSTTQLPAGIERDEVKTGEYRYFVLPLAIVVEPPGPVGWLVAVLTVGVVEVVRVAFSKYSVIVLPLVLWAFCVTTDTGVA
jgi:hypothetical protein